MDLHSTFQERREFICKYRCTNWRKNSFSYTVAKIWNSLQPEARKDNLSKFINTIRNGAFELLIIVLVMMVILLVLTTIYLGFEIYFDTYVDILYFFILVIFVFYLHLRI